MLLLAAVLGGMAIRAAFLHGAHRLLDRWEQRPLASGPIEGTGPRLPLGWPPRAEWRNLKWRLPGGGWVESDRLVVRLLTWPLFRGRLQVGSVDLDTLRVSGRPDWERWASCFPRMAVEHRDAEPAPRPDPRAFRWSAPAWISGTASGSLLTLEGWGWSTGAGKWNLTAHVLAAGGRAADLNAHGIASPGRHEVSLAILFAPHRAIQTEWGRGGGIERYTRISAEDDGVLLASMVDSLPFVGAWAPSGSIELSIEQTGDRPFDGEVRIGALRIPLGDESPAELQGLVCIQAGVASLQDVRVRSGRSDLAIEGDLPLGPATAPGWLRLEGILDGHRFLTEGSVSVAPDSIVWRPAGIQWGKATATEAEIAWLRRGGAPFLGSGRLRATCSLGGGEIVMDEWGGAGGGMEARGTGLPLGSLIPWLPFDLAGDWSGSLDAAAIVRRRGGEWVVAGTAMGRDGRVAGLEILDQIAGLTGNAGRGVLRFREARTRWAYRSGGLFADSLFADVGRMRIEGTLYYAGSDSVLGVLRVSPGEDRGIASLLRLLGGSAGSIDLGIRGHSDRPDDDSARQRVDRLLDSRAGHDSRSDPARTAVRRRDAISLPARISAGNGLRRP